MKRILLVTFCLSAVLAGCGKDSTSSSSTDAPVGCKAVKGSAAYATLKVPSQCTTIQAAVDAAGKGDLVLVSPGVYKEAVTVETEDITIRGTDRNKTIIDGEFQRDNGIKVFSNGVVVENLTSRNHKGNGVFFTGNYSEDSSKNQILTGYRASYVTAYNNGDYGIYAFNATKGQFDHDLGSGSPDAGFYIGQCNPCAALLTDDISETNMLGYSGTSENGETLAPNAATTIIGNVIDDNNSSDAPLTDKYAIGQGGGIVLGGTSNNIVERNRINKQPLAGIILTDQPEKFTPKNNTVRNNVITNSGYGLVAAMFTSGTSSNGNCFEGNTFTGMTGGDDFPAGLQKKSKCGGPDFDLGDMSSVISKVLPTPPNKDWKTVAAPADQPQMPNAAKAPAVPARGPTLPDLTKLLVPSA